MNFVNELLDRNPTVRPSRTKTDTLILKDGRKYRQLVDAMGQLTPAGRAYEAKSGEVLPRTVFDQDQRPFREGNVEYIKRGDENKITRRYDDRTNDWKYTALGRKFYNQKQISYVVQVPALFTGKRSNGQDYERAGWFPLDNPFKIKASVSQANRDLFIKQGVNATYPDGILA